MTKTKVKVHENTEKMLKRRKECIGIATKLYADAKKTVEKNKRASRVK